MKDFALRVDTAQYHTVMLESSGILQRYSVLADSRKHCCKLRIREAIASTAKQQSRSGLTLSGDVEGARGTES